MTMDCPRPFSISAATLRATMVLEPPGAKGTTRRIGFVGYVCASDAAEIANESRNRTVFIVLLELIAAQTAVDGNHRAGDVARERRGEEAHEVRDVRRLAVFADRDVLLAFFLAEFGRVVAQD